MSELLDLITSLKAADLILCAAAVVILDLFALSIIIMASREGKLCKKRWQKVSAGVELRLPDADFPLEADEILLGRHISADIRLTDPSVSRYHAVMTVSRGQWIITDLDSKGGTFVDGRRVHQSVVPPGSSLRLGNVELYLVHQSTPHRRPAAGTETVRRRKGGHRRV